MKLHDLTAAVIVLAWILLIVFLGAVGRRFKATPKAARHVSRVGFVLQGLAYALVFIGTGTRTSVPLGAATPLDVTVTVIVVLLAFASLAFGVWAARALGAQWSLTARMIEGHELVVSGPYRIVRHPIYLAMLGMLWATALAFSGPLMLVMGTAVYFVGTMVRIRSEDALLRETFGAEFEAYRERVPALLPRLSRFRF